MTLFTKAFEGKMMDFVKFFWAVVLGLIFMATQTFLQLIAMQIDWVINYVEKRKVEFFFIIFLLLSLRLVLY
jgi:hypothetical protein